MGKISLKTTIDITFIVIVTSFAILAYSIHSRSQSVRQNRMIVNHTSNINNVLEKVLSSTIDIETGTRGYTITGDENYLEVYNHGHKNLEIWIDSLRSMNETDEYQNKKLDTLEKLIESKQKVSAMVIKARREYGMEEAAELIKKGRGKEVMDSIRRSIRDYQNQAVLILSDNLAQTEENVQARNNRFFLFIIVTFAILIFAYIKIRQNTKRLLLDKIIQENLMDELTIQNQQLNDFASITSHNLRSPASNITALIATIEDDSPIEEYKTIFEMLKKVAQNLNDSLNQLMEVLHIKKNKIEKEILSFQQVYSKTIESLQGEILKSGAIIKADFKEVAEIAYSRIYLESIFHNLISNALKYRALERTPEITIRSERKNNIVYLYVIDNGLGIDLTKNGHKIFGMNQIFHNHPEAKGIGLFMTKTQIESMKGKISVASEVNIGTTFTVMFGT
ncbi:CHASE3 domain sensor protein/two-component sensor histidine kinase [Flavobacterium sp. 28YEA47A]|uniref:sensor histidine kinase n=1 Tax=Flavobacterium sp. 28YEA47A TaxID=3156276 RepID=UPI003514B13C